MLSKSFGGGGGGGVNLSKCSKCLLGLSVFLFFKTGDQNFPSVYFSVEGERHAAAKICVIGINKFDIVKQHFKNSNIHLDLLHNHPNKQ